MLDAAVLLANPNAGRVDDAAIGAVCRVLPLDAPVEVVVTEHPADVPAVLERLDGRALLIMGGDGTLNVVVGGLHRQQLLEETPVGFVPAGTANAFARAVGLPLDPRTAVLHALAGRPHRFDLLVGDDGHVAVNDLHTGLGIPATRLSRRLKPVLRQLTYSVANATVGLGTKGWDIQVAVDGGPSLVADGERVLAVAIGNSELVGDGTPMWPGAAPDDGLADVVVLLAGHRGDRVRLGLALKDGRHLGRSDVRHSRGAEIVLSGDVPGHNADGEVVEPATLRWRVEAGAWQLLS